MSALEEEFAAAALAQGLHPSISLADLIAQHRTNARFAGVMEGLASRVFVLAQTPEELDTLPIGSVIRDDQTLVLERYTSGWRNGWRDPVQNVAHLAYPVRILFTPEEETS